MHRKILSLLTVFCLAIPLYAEDAPPPKLEDAKTFEEIETWLENAMAKLNSDVQKIAQTEKMTMATVGPFIKQLADNIVSAGEKMLTVAKGDDQKKTAYETLLQGLKQKEQSEKLLAAEKLKKEKGFTEDDEKDMTKMMALFAEVEKLESAAAKRAAALLEEIEKEGKFLELVNKEKIQKFMRRAGEVYSNFSMEKFEAFKAEAKEWVNRKVDGMPPSQPLMTVLQLAETDEAQEADPKIVEKTIEELIAFVKSDACKLPAEEKADIVAQFEGQKKRSIGAELNLYGKTLDDKDFDWKALRGKYVLVKFTASWCGPCKGEIPGMKKAYEKYKAKGFEIVSVYVWDKLDAVKEAVEEEKLPWIIVSEELTEKAGGAPQGKGYAVQGVPTMLLIDKEGKVMATEVRGNVLEEKLAELLDK